MPLVTVAGLTRHYVGPAEVIRAVGTIDLSIEAGELLLLRGPSGAGKSTLLRLLAGLEPADSGTVLAGGRDVTAMSSDEAASLRAHDIGVVFQDNNLVPEFSAIENVMLPLELRGDRGAQVRDEAAAWLHRVGLAGLEDRAPDQLSGGQQQRVGIARALIGGRSILLADEPTGSLDSTNATAIFSTLRELADQGVLVVISTHDPLAVGFADRVISMRDGCIAEDSATTLAGMGSA